MSDEAAAPLDLLCERSADMAMGSMVRYFYVHKYHVGDYVKAADVLRKHLPPAVVKGTAEARECIGIGMVEVGAMTFAATVRLAGISAAKEVIELGL